MEVAFSGKRVTDSDLVPVYKVYVLVLGDFMTLSLTLTLLTLRSYIELTKIFVILSLVTNCLGVLQGRYKLL
jgi:hypothetical protein